MPKKSLVSITLGGRNEGREEQDEEVALHRRPKQVQIKIKAKKKKKTTAKTVSVRRRPTKTFVRQSRTPELRQFTRPAKTLEVERKEKSDDGEKKAIFPEEKKTETKEKAVG